MAEGQGRRPRPASTKDKAHGGRGTLARGARVPWCTRELVAAAGGVPWVPETEARSAEVGGTQTPRTDVLVVWVLISLGLGLLTSASTDQSHDPSHQS